MKLSADVPTENLTELQAALEKHFRGTGFEVKCGSDSEFNSLVRKLHPNEVPQTILVKVNFLRLENGDFVHFVTISLPATGFFLHLRGDAAITIPNPLKHQQPLNAGAALAASCEAYETDGAIARSREWSGVVAATVGEAKQYTSAWREANK